MIIAVVIVLLNIVTVIFVIVWFIVSVVFWWVFGGVIEFVCVVGDMFIGSRVIYLLRLGLAMRLISIWVLLSSG